MTGRLAGASGVWGVIVDYPGGQTGYSLVVLSDGRVRLLLVDGPVLIVSPPEASVIDAGRALLDSVTSLLGELPKRDGVTLSEEHLAVTALTERGRYGGEVSESTDNSIKTRLLEICQTGDDVVSRIRRVHESRSGVFSRFSKSDNLWQLKFVGVFTAVGAIAGAYASAFRPELPMWAGSFLGFFAGMSWGFFASGIGLMIADMRRRKQHQTRTD